MTTTSPPNTKLCSQCGEDKPFTEYYADRRNKTTGLQAECKTCHTLATNAATRNRPLETRLLYSARYRAKIGGFPCTITEADIVVPTHCPILGIELVRGEGQSSEASPTLDKINPALGYVPGNVQVISYRANSMKRDASADELRRFAKWVLENMDGM